MGNSGSRQGDDRRQNQDIGISASKYHHHHLHQSQHKVLLDLNTAPKLRATENGIILHSGGTISQRRPDKSPDDPPSRGDSLEFKRNFYGSEPDLRFNSKDEHLGNENVSKLRVSRTRKKYKAPAAPQHDHSVPDYFDDWEVVNGVKPSRRLRLFITRAEATKKKTQEQSPINVVNNVLPPTGRLRRSLSTPQFQQEQESLRAYDEDAAKSSGDALDTIENITKPPHINPVHHTNVEHNGNNSFLEELREKQMLRETRHTKTPSRSSDTKAYNHMQHANEEDLWLVANKAPVPVKTFYFGMDEPVDDPFGFDSFSPKANVASYSSSESQLSSNDGFTDIIYDETSGGISVQLRATLPRKQIDIPRFSPAAAWRLLSTIEPLPISQEEDVIQLESRIAAPPHPIQIPAVMDKSADSGISGDASPQQYDSAAWTPQQDLEDTSSDGCFPINFFTYDKCSDVKYTPRFTLSLPKDDKTALFSYTEVMEDLNQQIAKKSIFSFGKNASNSLNLSDTPFLDNNWMLSCSIPSSISFLNNHSQQVNNDDSCKVIQEDDCSSTLIKKPSFSYLTSGGHIMYLPEYSKPKDLEDTKILSKSCENLSKSAEVEPPDLPNSYYQQAAKIKTSKKFTFQSTIRQNERKMLAEKLSRLAEYTELKRRSEMEVMQKVEEEFQKKREREKADIRQQLRLYNINNRAFASLESSASNP